ncbi:MAG: transglycosylase domain-containing protein, partial [Patescibacteria group bacterium]
MDITSIIAIFIVKLLIFIGDIVLYLVRLFFYFLPRIIFGWLISFLLKTLEKTKKGFSSLTNFRINLPKKTPKVKRKKVKKIKIFPFSTFWIKVRYFILGFIFSAIFIFTPLLFLIFIQDLPSPHTLALADSALTTKIYDRNGELLYQIYANQNRTFVPISDIPQALQEASIAIEDKGFYTNPGFDIEAIARSAVANISGKPIQGGSTITQQLIKSELLTPQISISRKIKEIILAFWAEKIYTKSQILEMYLNEIPYGGSAWGVEAASQTYFGKN